MSVETLPIGGYVLAGGASSRMGTDKALIELGGRPLVELAVAKLQQLCREVRVLSSKPELACYAPLVPDVHPGCGPLSGIEAALAHSRWEWNLIVPVDLPFVPVTFLRSWMEGVTADTEARAAYCEVGGRPHPALLLIHRDSKPEITAALKRGEYKLLPVLETAAGTGLRVQTLAYAEAEGWFANINTPEDLETAKQKWEAAGKVENSLWCIIRGDHATARFGER